MNSGVWRKGAVSFKSDVGFMRSISCIDHYYPDNPANLVKRIGRVDYYFKTAV